MFGGMEEGERGRAFAVVALCAAIFFADASHSVAIPIFPSFARSLGASLTFIGALGSASSAAMLLLSVPLGSLSDRFGRRGVMALGFLCFSAVPLVYTASSSPAHLLPARLLLGVAMGSTFSIGFIYTSELAPDGLRSLAQGLYMTSMGTGFTLGPLLGGFMARNWGYGPSFYLSSGFAIAGLLSLMLVRSPRNGEGKTNRGPSRPGPAGVGEILGDPRMLAAGVANFLNSLMFSALTLFFPLYGASVGLDEGQVGLGFTARGLSSTAIRFPSGALARRAGVLRLMALGLGVSAATLLLLPSSEGLTAISVLLGVQGVAYGVYLTTGHAYVAQEAPGELRGTAMGVYSAFSNVSGIVSPLLLGAIAESWGLGGVFQASAALCLGGIVFMLLLVKRGEGGPAMGENI
jgi:MFS family permease